jgi:hypothetical protein
MKKSWKCTKIISETKEDIRWTYMALGKGPTADFSNDSADPSGFTTVTLVRLFLVGYFNHKSV